MKKINLYSVMTAIPTWVYAATFFALVALAYIILNHYLGFDHSAWLTR